MKVDTIVQYYSYTSHFSDICCQSVTKCDQTKSGEKCTTTCQQYCQTVLYDVSMVNEYLYKNERYNCTTLVYADQLSLPIATKDISDEYPIGTIVGLNTNNNGTCWFPNSKSFHWSLGDTIIVLVGCIFVSFMCCLVASSTPDAIKRRKAQQKESRTYELV